MMRLPLAVSPRFARMADLLRLHRSCFPFVNLSFSQEGEDLVLHRLLNYKPIGYIPNDWAFKRVVAIPGMDQRNGTFNNRIAET